MLPAGPRRQTGSPIPDRSGRVHPNPDFQQRYAFTISGAAMAVAVGVFGASLVASPARTEASTYVMAQTDPLQMTLNAPRDLPSFDDTYQRHTGVLDTLRP